MDILGYLQEQMGSLDIGFDEVVCPSTFKCSSGAKYKARALHYAILNSRASDTDWIIHLDEETRFDIDTVKHTLAHCVHNDMLVSHGKQVFGDIGQGVILYGANKEIDNYITTLADSFRVSDDLGKFRLQFYTKRPWIGMHGSFVVCPNAVEKHIGFDHGMPGSITEDAYFALVAWERGVKFAWVDTYMYEQSPFSIYDFIMQRRRWFGGVSQQEKSPYSS
jgi:egghead protein (zeste-white 4 protein)